MSYIDKINVKGIEYDIRDALSRSQVVTLSSQVSSLANGSPKGTYATVSLLSQAHPLGNTNIYVVKADGCWYYWDINSSRWVSGGVYLTNVETISRTIVFSISGNLAIGETLSSFIVPYNLTINKVYYCIDGIPKGSSIIFDLHKNGNTIYTTQANRPTLETSTAVVEGVTPDDTSLLAGDKLTLDIDQVGSLVTGFGLNVTLVCTEVI